MAASSRERAFIAGHEGVVLKAYRCPAGVWTIGVGHTSAAGAPKVTPGMTITREDAFAILERDLGRFRARVEKRLGPLPEAGRAGSVSFDFNTGRIHNATWPKLFLAGKAAAAEASLKQWNKGGGRVLKGLTRRRAEEADLIFRGRWPAAMPDETTARSKSREEIASLQKALTALGYYSGTVDGLAGPLTDGAVKNFQRAEGLTVDGIVGPATRAALTRALDRRTANKASAGGGTAAGAGAGGAEVATESGSVDPSAAPVDAIGDVNLLLVLAAGLGVAALIWAGFWLWRNRGRITGRRVAT